MTKIVLAEDDHDLCFLLDKILNQAGYSVKTLNEGSPIVNGQVERPDIFILDQQMPVIDGFALSKYLKINKDTKGVPIVMISAYPELKSKAARLGIDDFLQKPFTTEDLLRTINRHISPVQ